MSEDGGVPVFPDRVESLGFQKCGNLGNRAFVVDFELSSCAVAGRGLLDFHASAFDGQVEVVSQSLHSQLESRQPLHIWAQGVVRMLQAVYRDFALQPDQLRDRGISACWQELSDAAESLEQVPTAVMLKCTAAQAIQFLLRETG